MPEAAMHPPTVVLVNLGTPEAPTPAAVRTYLREFLTDRRVIEMSPLLWRPILEGIVLRVRPRASAARYAGVWGPDGSPLLAASTRLRDQVARALGGQAEVRLAMRYGQPSLARLLRRLREQGRRRLLILPLYPQYTATCAGTVMDLVDRFGLAHRDRFELRTVRSFPTDRGYVEAVARGVEDAWRRVGRPNFARGDRLIVSFHGIPQAMERGGDPYRGECQATARALRERLHLSEQAAPMTFQSKFGPAPWLGPATLDTVRALGAAGARRVDVVCPGFTADCLETLEEIDRENRRAFADAGGGAFHYLPWSNDRPAWVGAVVHIALRHLQGWETPSMVA